MADDALEYESGDPDRRRGQAPYYPPNVPPGTSTFGMWLFLAALFMLFAAVMVGYLVIRLGGAQSPPAHSIHIPRLLWLSTALVIATSFTLERALKFVKLQKLPQFHQWLLISLGLAVGFIVVQTPAMIELLEAHRQLRSQRMFLYGLVFFLILIHAAHVVGGIVAMLRIVYVARRGDFDHEHYQPVRHAAMYWHFLDAVWLVMFFTFLVIG